MLREGIVERSRSLQNVAGSQAENTVFNAWMERLLFDNNAIGPVAKWRS